MTARRRRRVLELFAASLFALSAEGTAQVEISAGPILTAGSGGSLWGARAAIGLRMPGELRQVALDLAVVHTPASSTSYFPGIASGALELSVATGSAPAAVFTVAAARTRFDASLAARRLAAECPAATCQAIEGPTHWRSGWRTTVMPGFGLLIRISSALQLTPHVRGVLPVGSGTAGHDDLGFAQFDIGLRWRP